MRTKKFIYNSSSSALLQVITIASGLIVPRVILEYYGSEINGLISSITQFLGYLYLVEAGLASAAIYSLYKPLAEKNKDEINGILTAVKKFYSLTGYIFLFLVLLLSVFYPFFTETTKLNNLETCFLVLILGMTSTINFFILAKYQVLLMADQKTYVLSFISIISIVLQTLIIVIFSKIGVSIITLRLITLASMFIRSALLHLYVKWKYKFVRYNVKPNYSALNKRWDALFLQIMGVIQSGSPIVIATFFLPFTAVSVYSIYGLVDRALSGIFSVFISVSFASFGEVIAKKEMKTLQNSYQEFELSFHMLITIAYSTAMIIIMPFIELYTSGIDDENYILPLLGTLFIINGLMDNIKTPQGILVISAGLFKETKKNTVIQAIILIAGSLIFVQVYGIYGILVGPILSNIYRSVDFLIFIPRNVTKLSISSSLVKMIRTLITFIIITYTFPFDNTKTVSYKELSILIFEAVTYSTLIVFVINYIFDKRLLISAIKRFKFKI